MAPRVPRRRVDGVLLLDKPTGLSSNAALQRARRLFNAEKAGHTGTLDPLASGLLPVLFGEATKFAQYLLDADKRYVATVAFGTATDTGDAEGRVTERAPVDVDEARLLAALRALTGRQRQIPPMHSALKHQGRPYYDYARRGETVVREAREIEIHALDLVGWDTSIATLDVHCSKGTYVRVLAEDLGRRLGTVAHLAGLRRTGTGGFGLAQAVTLEALEPLPDAERDALLAPTQVLVAHLPRIELSPDDAARLRHGQAVALAAPDGMVACVAEGRLLGLASVAGRMARPLRLVREDDAAVGS